MLVCSIFSYNSACETGKYLQINAMSTARPTTNALDLLNTCRFYALNASPERAIANQESWLLLLQAVSSHCYSLNVHSIPVYYISLEVANAAPGSNARETFQSAAEYHTPMHLGHFA